MNKKFFILTFSIFFLFYAENINSQTPAWQLKISSQTSGNFKFPVSFTETKNNSSIKESLSFKFNTSNLNINFATSTDNLSIENYTYGIHSHINIKNFPLAADFYAGTLKYSAAVSRLKNPSLYTGSLPLKNAFLPSAGIFPYLPSQSTSSADLSAAIKIFPVKKNSFFPSIDSAIFLNKSAFISLYKSFNLFSLNKLGLSLTSAFLPHGKEFNSVQKDSWFTERPFYPVKNYFSSEGLLNFSSPDYKASAIFSIFENPFGKPFISFVTHQNFCLEDFTLNFSLSAASKKLITASGSYPKQFFQYFINPQYVFYISDSSLNCGISFMQDFCTNDKNKTFYYIYYGKAQILFSLYNYSLNSLFSVNFNTDDQKLNFSEKILFQNHKDSLSSSSYFLFKSEQNLLTESVSTSYTLNQSLNFKTKIPWSLNGTFTVNTKNSEYNGIKAAVNASVNFSYKHIKSSFKIEFNCSA